MIDIYTRMSGMAVCLFDPAIVWTENVQNVCMLTSMTGIQHVMYGVGYGHGMSNEGTSEDSENSK